MQTPTDNATEATTEFNPRTVDGAGDVFPPGSKLTSKQPREKKAWEEITRRIAERVESLPDWLRAVAGSPTYLLNTGDAAAPSWKPLTDARLIQIEVGAYLYRKKIPNDVKWDAKPVHDRIQAGAAMQPQSCFVGSMPGFQPGYYKAGIAAECEALITAGPRLIKPVEGSWDTIKSLLAGMFGDTPGQLERFYGWLQRAVTRVRQQKHWHLPALLVAGDAGSGKTLSIDSIITPALGGRAALAYNFASGGSNFNAELFNAELLVVDDASAKLGVQDRRALSDFIKQVTSQKASQLHGKFRTAVAARPIFAFALACNMEPTALAVLPDFMRDDVGDRVLLLKATAQPMPSPAPGKDLPETLEAEVPAFLHFLTEFKLPEELADVRFGVKGWQHPEAVEAHMEVSTEQEILEWMDAHPGFFGEGPGPTARTLRAGGLKREAEQSARVPSWARLALSTLGSALSNLATRRPERVRKFEKVRVRGERTPGTFYVIKPPSPHRTLSIVPDELTEDQFSGQAA